MDDESAEFVEKAELACVGRSESIGRPVVDEERMRPGH